MATQTNPGVTILVKALPQPSKKYGETVCCAGVTSDRKWKRLFPVRFRHLSGDSSFARWDRVSFDYGRPIHDAREESCHVHEESIKIVGKLAENERSGFLNPIILGSAKAAEALGRSLARIRPRKTQFFAKAKSKIEVEQSRESFRKSASQTSMFDQELAEMEPSPYDFRFKFEDDAGPHEYQNGDWEAHAMFWRETKRSSEAAALKWMHAVFNEDYPKRGMVFALGNQAKRPQTWQLLGVIRLDVALQEEFIF